MKQLQPPTMCTYRRPDILMRQAPADLPGLAQKTDRPVNRHTPHKMQPSCRDWQSRRHPAGLALAQPHTLNLALCLGWCHPIQARWSIHRCVPIHKHALPSHHITDRAKVIAFPELLRPQAIDPFHHRIALGFTWRQKDDFNPQVQAQPNHTPQPALGSFATSKGSIIVQIQAVRQAQRLPGGEQMGAHTCDRFIRSDGLVERAGFQIHCMKNKDLGATLQIACNPITRVPDDLRSLLRLRIVAFWLLLLNQRLCDACREQPAFDGCQRWHLLKQSMVTDLLLNRLRADQANLSLLQGLSHTQDNRVSVLSIGLWRMHGSTRAIVQTFASQTSKALPPFAQPLTFARDACEYLARAPAFETESNRLTAPIQIIKVLCHRVPPLAPLWQQPNHAHDVVSHTSIRMPTMS